MKRGLLRSGITLIEVLASILVLCIGLIGVIAVLPYGAFQVSQAQHTEYAANMLANAAEEVVLRGMTSPGTWGTGDMLTSGGCPPSLQTKLDTWLKTPGEKIPSGAEEFLVFARRWNGNILNCDKIIWVEPNTVADPDNHIFRVGGDFGNGSWKELMRGQDDLEYIRSENGERPDLTGVKSTGKYTWFFTFKPQKMTGEIIDVTPVSRHFGMQPVFEPPPHPIQTVVNVRKNNSAYDPAADPPSQEPEYIPCTVTLGFNNNVLQLLESSWQAGTAHRNRLHRAGTLLINQKYYTVKGITSETKEKCDHGESLQSSVEVLSVAVEECPAGWSTGVGKGEPEQWYIPKPFASLTNSGIDVLACWNRVPEDDVQVACTFQRANNGGSFLLPDDEHLEKLTQTKYVFVTWNDGSEVHGEWCRIVFIDKNMPQIFVTGRLPQSFSSPPQVYIVSGVLYHKRIR